MLGLALVNKMNKTAHVGFGEAKPALVKRSRKSDSEGPGLVIGVFHTLLAMVHRKHTALFNTQPQGT